MIGEHVIKAAGGVVWRPRESSKESDDVEVAIVHRPRYDDWSIPKGKLAVGESVVECAIREVFEETGYRVRMGRYLGEAHYMKVSGAIERPKVVYYWALRADGGLFTPTQEVDGLRWLTVDDARAMLTRATDKDMIDRFAEVAAHAHPVTRLFEDLSDGALHDRLAYRQLALGDAPVLVARPMHDRDLDVVARFR